MNEELMGIEKNNIMTQNGFNLNVPIKSYVDNVSAINIAKNPFFHQRSKHIDFSILLPARTSWKEHDQIGILHIKISDCRYFH